MNHFNQAANQWDTPEKIEQNKNYAEEIKSLSGKKDFSHILEVGCGTGLLGSQFVTPASSLTGVDTSEGMLDVFNKKFSSMPNVRSVKINLEKEDLDENSFDLILSSMAFHHLTEPEAMIKKLRTKLSPAGLIAVIDLDKEDGTFHPDPIKMGVHHSGFAKEVIEKWASKNELNVQVKIINTIHKNEKQYPIFLALFSPIKH